VATLKFSRRFFPGTIVIDRPIELISTAELYLLHEDLRVLRESRPDGFIFENVTRFLNPSNPYALGTDLDDRAPLPGRRTYNGCMWRNTVSREQDLASSSSYAAFGEVKYANWK